MKQKAIFLDRDGVINIEKEYLYKIEDFEFIDGVIESLKYLQTLGYKLFVITNQSGIGRGYYTKEDFLKLSHWMLDTLDEYGIRIEQVEYCPHTPDAGCKCRKPDTLMIENILQNHEIDLNNSWPIGDKKSDIECANKASIKHTIQVQSGHSFDNSIAEYVIDSLHIDYLKDIIKS